jgi:hypothetical protein
MTQQHMSQTLARIKDKLDQLREIDTEFRVFGSNHHQYKIKDPATENQVSSFESRFNVILPDEYREYLLKFGNGGAGPDYGISPLRVDWNPTQEELTDMPRLDRAFLFTTRWECPEDESDVDRFLEDRYFEDGCLHISPSGCATYSVLVVTGAERGRVWYDSIANDGLIEPSGMTFYQWFETWLDRHLGNDNI